MDFGFAVFSSYDRRKDRLKNLSLVSSCTIYFPNRSEAIVVERGSAYLAQNFIVRHLLLILELKRNLVSLGQLIDETNCSISMSTGLLVIQDHILKMLI